MVRKSIELDTQRLGFSNQVPHRAMSLAKAGSLPNEVVRQIGGHEPARKSSTHSLGAKLNLGQAASERRKDEGHRVDGVEQGALVVLQVLVVATRQPLDRGQEGREVAEETSTGSTR